MRLLELVRDFRQAFHRVFARDIHCQLPRRDERLRPLQRIDLFQRDVVAPGGGLLNFQNRQVSQRLFLLDEVFENVREDVRRERASRLDLAEDVDTIQRPFHCAHVALDRVGDVFKRVVRNRRHHAVGFLLENGEARLVVRRLDLLHHAALEARDETRLNCRQILRRDVGRHHDLLVRLLQSVEGVEELLLTLLALLEELDVVHHQQVHLSVAVAEGLDVAVLEVVDEFVQEDFGRQVADVERGVLPLEFVADGLHEVRLAEPRSAVDEQRVVAALSGIGDNAFCGCESPAVAGAFHELVERVVDVQRHRRRQGSRLFPGDCRLFPLANLGIGRGRHFRREGKRLGLLFLVEKFEFRDGFGKDEVQALLQLVRVFLSDEFGGIGTGEGQGEDAILEIGGRDVGEIALDLVSFVGRREGRKVKLLYLFPVFLRDDVFRFVHSSSL